MDYPFLGNIGPYAVTLADGETVYRAIHPELRAGRPVRLDFTGVEAFAAPFFNAAIGALLEDLSVDDLNRLLCVDNLSSGGTLMVRLVIEHADQYYHNPAVRRAVDAMLDERAEAI
jgi:hypothetical protein